ncbi:MAG: hypothetical protein KAR11_00145 [Phycisphaerae bacterium]|nr:hypothetical protein [Phycisphaerae bacterium]
MNRFFSTITFAIAAVLIIVTSGVLFAGGELGDIAGKALDKTDVAKKAAKTADGLKSKVDPKPESKPETPQQQADALQLKVNALNSLNGMLSTERVNAKARVKMMQGYLQFLGKTDDYAKSDLPNAKSPQVMTFGHAVAEAIEHEKTKPPVNVDHVDAAEIALLKRSESATENLCKKMWDEVNAAHDQASRIAGYLKSIDKLNGYQKWAGLEVEKQKQAAAAKHKKMHAAAVAAKDEKQKAAQQRQKDRYAEMHQEHLTNMQRQFELKRLKMQEDAAYKLAPRQRNNYWHGWDDQYNDVHHR